MPKKASQKSLDNWTREKWGTKSGKPSLKTGERYLPKAAREALTDEEYARTSRKKREGMRAGKQFVKQPKKIAEKTAKYRSKKRLLKSARKLKSSADSCFTYQRRKTLPKHTEDLTNSGVLLPHLLKVKVI